MSERQMTSAAQHHNLIHHANEPVAASTPTESFPTTRSASSKNTRLEAAAPAFVCADEERLPPKLVAAFEQQQKSRWEQVRNNKRVIRCPPPTEDELLSLSETLSNPSTWLGRLYQTATKEQSWSYLNREEKKVLVEEEILAKHERMTVFYNDGTVGRGHVFCNLKRSPHHWSSCDNVVPVDSSGSEGDCESEGIGEIREQVVDSVDRIIADASSSTEASRQTTSVTTLPCPYDHEKPLLSEWSCTNRNIKAMPARRPFISGAREHDALHSTHLRNVLTRKQLLQLTQHDTEAVKLEVISPASVIKHYRKVDRVCGKAEFFRFSGDTFYKDSETLKTARYKVHLCTVGHVSRDRGSLISALIRLADEYLIGDLLSAAEITSEFLHNQKIFTCVVGPQYQWGGLHAGGQRGRCALSFERDLFDFISRVFNETRHRAVGRTISVPNMSVPTVYFVGAQRSSCINLHSDNADGTSPNNAINCQRKNTDVYGLSGGDLPALFIVTTVQTKNLSLRGMLSRCFALDRGRVVAVYMMNPGDALRWDPRDDNQFLHAVFIPTTEDLNALGAKEHADLSEFFEGQNWTIFCDKICNRAAGAFRSCTIMRTIDRFCPYDVEYPQRRQLGGLERTRYRNTQEGTYIAGVEYRR